MKQVSILLLVLFMLLYLTTATVVADVNPASLVDQEKAILQELFEKKQIIETTLRRIEITEERIEAEAEQLLAIDEKLAENQAHIASDQKTLSLLLATYQKQGMTSWLELLLSSESPRDFLSRLNLFGELLTGTRETMQNLTSRQSEMETIREEQKSRLLRLEVERQTLVADMEALETSRAELEAQLTSLRQERLFFEERLMRLEAARADAMADFERLAEAFPGLLTTGTLPSDSISQRLTLGGLEASVTAEGFNTLLADRQDLPPSQVRFEEDSLILFFPDHDLLLSGELEVNGPTELIWSVTGGELAGYPLFSEHLLQMEGRQLSLDLSPLISPHELKAITISEETLQLLLRLKLF